MPTTRAAFAAESAGQEDSDRQSGPPEAVSPAFPASAREEQRQDKIDRWLPDRVHLVLDWKPPPYSVPTQAVVENGSSTSKGKEKPLKSSGSTKAPTFYDMHFDKRLVLKEVYRYPELTSDLLDNLDRLIYRLIDKGVTLPPTDALPNDVSLRHITYELATSVSPKENSVQELYLKSVAAFCAPIASTLLLHPNHTEWTSAFHWTSSVNVHSSAISDGTLTFKSPPNGNAAYNAFLPLASEPPEPGLPPSAVASHTATRSRDESRTVKPSAGTSAGSVRENATSSSSPARQVRFDVPIPTAEPSHRPRVGRYARRSQGLSTSSPEALQETYQSMKAAIATYNPQAAQLLEHIRTSHHVESRDLATWEMKSLVVGSDDFMNAIHSLTGKIFPWQFCNKTEHECLAQHDRGAHQVSSVYRGVDIKTRGLPENRRKWWTLPSEGIDLEVAGREGDVTDDDAGDADVVDQVDPPSSQRTEWFADSDTEESQSQGEGSSSRQPMTSSTAAGPSKQSEGHLLLANNPLRGKRDFLPVHGRGDGKGDPRIFGPRVLFEDRVPDDQPDVMGPSTVGDGPLQGMAADLRLGEDDARQSGDDDTVQEDPPPRFQFSAVNYDDPEYQPELGVSPRWIVQQAWAQAVRTDASVLVIHSGNHEYIGIRERSTQRFFLSDLIRPWRFDGYGKLQVALYVAIIQDALARRRKNYDFNSSKGRPPQSHVGASWKPYRAGVRMTDILRPIPKDGWPDDAPKAGDLEKEAEEKRREEAAQVRTKTTKGKKASARPPAGASRTRKPRGRRGGRPSRVSAHDRDADAMAVDNDEGVGASGEDVREGDEEEEREEEEEEQVATTPRTGRRDDGPGGGSGSSGPPGGQGGKDGDGGSKGPGKRRFDNDDEHDPSPKKKGRSRKSSEYDAPDRPDDEKSTGAAGLSAKRRRPGQIPSTMAEPRAGPRTRGAVSRDQEKLDALLADIGNRNSFCLSIRYGVYNSVVPARFTRSTPSSHLRPLDPSKKDAPAPRRKRKLPGPKFKILEDESVKATTHSQTCFGMVLTSELGYGSLGITHGAVVVLGPEHDHAKSNTSNIGLAVKLAINAICSESLIREYTIYATLESAGVKGIPTVFGVFEDVEDGATALVMTNAGQSLRGEQTLTYVQRQSFVDTLQAIHNVGFIHGDISQSNLLINDKGETCIIDFHLAMRTSRVPRKSQEMKALKEILDKKLVKVRGL